MSENSFNRVEVSGFAEDVTLRQTTTGKPVANFSLKLVTTDRTGTPHFQFIRTTAWQGHAQRVAELPKGSRVRILGRLTTASWIDKESQKRVYRLELTADELDAVQHLQSPVNHEERANRPIDDSDIPF